MKKSIISIISIVSILLSSFSVSAAEVPRESVPCNASNEAIVLVESFIGDILAEVQNGLGYADARAKSNRIFFNAWLNGHTNGYSYGELVDIANATIWQCRDIRIFLPLPVFRLLSLSQDHTDRVQLHRSFCLR